MKRRKKKSEYLSYIEETEKHYNILDEVAKKATQAAFKLTKSKNLPVTYIVDNQIIREHNGIKEVIEIVKNPSIKVKKGVTIQLR